MLKIFITFIFFQSMIFSQFGKNIVQYKSFDWNYIQTEHFDIYFYDKDINAQYVAFESDKAYQNISNALNWNLKNRVPIIVYNSHNDFQQTNVIDMYMPEGVGGVTELYKNRVVIPYDGSHTQFKHVIHHELVHAFVNDYLYKGNAMNMQNESINPIPLWMNEGLAEFLTETWNTESEMWIRDIVINGNQLPTFNDLNGYLAYRGGHSVWKFLVEKYDTEHINNSSNSPTIISKIFKSVSQNKDLNEAFKQSIGMNLSEIEEGWHKYLKENYYSDINDREYFNDFSTSLLNLKEMNANYNVAPSLSPDGKKLAFYSNDNGIMSLCIMPSDCNNCDRKKIKNILKSNITSNVEEFHILKPGISWSPNSNKLLVAVKSNGKDVMFIIDIDNGYKKIKLSLDDDVVGIFKPSWNPSNENLISFIGSNGFQTDIYIYNIQSNELINLTDDIYTEHGVQWVENGKNLIFSSDRNSNLLDNSSKINDNWGYQYDLFKTVFKNMKISSLIRLTNTSWNEVNPIMIDDETCIFISDRNGINNIYKMNVSNNFSEPISNSFTGITQITAAGTDIFFTGFEKMKFGIYKLDSTTFLNPKSEIENALWLKNYKNYEYLNEDKKINYKRNYSNYIFKKNKFLAPNQEVEQESKQLEIKKDSLNNYLSKKYKTRFTMDIGQMYYGFGFSGNDFSGGNGMAQFLFSDILGDHKIYIGTELNVNFKRSDYSFAYRYLPNLIDWTFMFYHDASEFGDGFFDQQEEIIDLWENFRFSINASRPISKFTRFDFGLNYYYLSRTEQVLENTGFGYRIVESNFKESYDISIFDFRYVWDNTKWAYTYPVRGSRFYIKYQTNPFKDFDTNLLSFDARLYKPFNNGLSLFFRNFTGTSWGDKSQKFFLGGAPSFYNSSNYNVTEYYSSQSQNLEEYYFSEHVMPIRGIPYMYKTGDNVIAYNLELRAPFLIYYFPTIKWVGQLNGIIFVDVGATWNKKHNIPNINSSENWEFRQTGDNNVNGWIMSYGFGPRFILFGLPLQVNYAWQYNPILKRSSSRRYEITIGFDL